MMLSIEKDGILLYVKMDVLCVLCTETIGEQRVSSVVSFLSSNLRIKID